MKPTGRLLSLDVLRGITIAGMIMVNNPGSWSYVYAPLRHAEWHGLTPTDLVFPFFMFIMGVSMFLSLKKYDWKLTKECVWKIVKRSILIFLVGYALNWFGYGLRKFVELSDLAFMERMSNSFLDFPNIRVLGVMQRLAIAYCFGSLLGCWVKKQKYIPLLAGAILLFYWIFQALFNGFPFSPDNIIAVVDNKLIGEPRLYHDTVGGVKLAFDPEGLLSAIGSIGHVLLGFYAGYLILNSKRDNNVAVQNLMLFGTIILFAGLLLNYGCPINKKIWTSTFALTTCGLASLFLALLIWFIDIKGYVKWSAFFESFGINPLFLYVSGGVFANIFAVSGIKKYICDHLLNPYLDPYFASLVYALLFVGFIWLLGYGLYKKQIYIKL